MALFDQFINFTPIYQKITEARNVLVIQIAELKELLMATASELKEAVGKLTQEVTETKELVTAQNAKISEHLAKIEELIEQDASDAELRAAVEEAVPAIRAASEELDLLQPKSEPPTE